MQPQLRPQLQFKTLHLVYQLNLMQTCEIIYLVHILNNLTLSNYRTEFRDIQDEGEARKNLHATNGQRCTRTASIRHTS